MIGSPHRALAALFLATLCPSGPAQPRSVLAPAHEVRWQSGDSVVQDQTRSPSKAPAPAAEITVRYSELRVDGFRLVYDLDYAGAREKFRKMTEIAPDLPAGYVDLATNAWLEILNQRRRLQIGLYSGTGFFSDSKSPAGQQSAAEVSTNVDRAIETAARLLAKDPLNAEALYYQGAAYSIRAAFQASVQRSFFSALSDGSKAVELHRKVLKNDPNYTDAYLTIGMYDYIVGSLPLPIRLLAAIGGVRGSKPRGLREVEIAARNGRYVAEDAQVLLVALYSREGRNEDSLRMLTRLANEHPKNYLLHVERAATLARLGRDAESQAVFESMVKNPPQASALDLIRYQYGESLFDKRDFAHAILQFRQVLSLEQAEEGLVTLSHLRAGQCYDALGNHRSALGHYYAVLKRPNVYDSHEQAKRYYETPYASSQN